MTAEKPPTPKVEIDDNTLLTELLYNENSKLESQLEDSRKKNDSLLIQNQFYSEHFEPGVYWPFCRISDKGFSVLSVCLLLSIIVFCMTLLEIVLIIEG